MRFGILACLMLLAGCAGGRPLAEGERALAADIFGASFDPDRATIAKLPGPTPEQSTPTRVASIEPRPGICDRAAPNTEPRGEPPAFVLYERMNVQPEFYRPDMMAGWPDQILFPEVLIMAHELVHIWQWQNRDVTGYRPARAAFENITNRDPYFYVPGPGAGLLEYGYEQQAALIEDYFCYMLYDPTAPRRAEIRKILAPHFTMDRLDAATGR